MEKIGTVLKNQAIPPKWPMSDYKDLQIQTQKTKRQAVYVL